MQSGRGTPGLPAPISRAGGGQVPAGRPGVGGGCSGLGSLKRAASWTYQVSPDVDLPFSPELLEDWVSTTCVERGLVSVSKAASARTPPASRAGGFPEGTCGFLLRCLYSPSSSHLPLLSVPPNPTAQYHSAPILS